MTMMMVSLSSRRVPVRCVDDETKRDEEKDQASRRADACDASIVFPRPRRRRRRRHLTQRAALLCCVLLLLHDIFVCKFLEE